VLVCGFGFDFGAQRFEADVPEFLEEGAQRGEAFGAGAIQATGAVAALLEQAGFYEDAEVLGDGGSRDLRKLGGDGAGSELVVVDEAQDGTAAGFGHGVEKVLHRGRYAALV
jgi:hypothetical protein